MTLEQVIEIIERYKLRIPPTVYYELLADIRNEQEPTSYQWCTDCREYDQEKHCCHRWSKAIRNTVEEMKQEYIEREVLDDLRAEVETEKLEDSPNFCIKAHNIAIDRVLGIIDKYKAEQEET